MALLGCGGPLAHAQGADLAVSSPDLYFGGTWVGRTATQSLTLSSTGTSALTISAASVTGTGFSFSGATFPITLNPGQTATLQLKFAPKAVGTSDGQLTITSNSAAGSSTIVSLTGTGTAPPAALNAISCTNASLTGAASDACTVTLTNPAASGGFVVNLSSSSADVTVPATVTVPANATSVGFTSNAASIMTAEAVTLTATAGSVSSSFGLQLNVAGAKLILSSTAASFGSVWMGRSGTQSITVSNGGAATLTISSISVTGAGIGLSPTAFPISLNYGQSTTLQLQFAPTVLGAVSGQLIIASNSITGASTVVSLSATGTPPPGTLSAISCTNATLAGAASDACTVSLNYPAASGGVVVNLSSSSTAVTLPATVTVPENATSASFTANAVSVSAAQAVTLTATSGTVSTTFGLQLNAQPGTLVLSTTAVPFGSVWVGRTGTQSLTLTNSSAGASTLTITAASVTGTGFTLLPTAFPISLGSGQTATLEMQFAPTALGAVSGQLTIASNSITGASTAVGLTGTGAAPPGTLSAISCTNATLTGAASDACTVSLNYPAASGGVVVNLSSSSTAVTLPATVTIPANATSVSFTANAASVGSAQAVTLTATSGSISTTFGLLLNVAGGKLVANSMAISFGNVWVGRNDSQSVTLTNAGTSTLTISAASVTGTVFSLLPTALPISLSAGQTATLQMQFAPTALGAASGQLIITSNSVTGTSTVVALTGTGAPPPASLSAISCSTASLTGAATDACTVTLNYPAASTGFAVNLSSSSSAVTIPASVTVPANATSVGFTANAASVTTAQSVTLTATAGTVTTSYGLQLNVAGAKLSSNLATVSFGGIWLGRSGTQSLTLTNVGAAALTISSASVTGTGFSLITTGFPITLNSGQSTTLQMQFTPVAIAPASGQLTINSNSITGPTTVLPMTATGTQPPAGLSSISCTNTSLTGNVSDTCTVTLTYPASSGGFTANLSSNDTAVTVPATVSVPANAISANFTANAAWVTTAQTATLTASAAGVTKKSNVTLNAAIISVSANTTSLAFGNVLANTEAAQPITIISTGSMPVTISAAPLTGAAFSLSGAALPITLNPGQTATLEVQFYPTAVGPVTGQLTFTSNITAGVAPAIALSGTGVPATSVATVGIGSTPGQPISPTFFGLSHEWGSAQTMMGDSTVGVDNIYRQLVQNLMAYGSGPIVLRIGGNSTDTSGQPTPTIAQPFAELADALPVKFYLGVNLGGDNVDLAMAQAAAFVNQMPAGSLDGIEIGNEPDAYAANGMRSASYAYPQYLTDFTTWQTNVMPLLPAGVKLMGPSWGGEGTSWLVNAQPFDAAEASNLATFSHHYYAANGQSTYPSDFLLLSSSTVNSNLSTIAKAVTQAHQSGIPFRIGELNSISAGGVNGISNTFQSALWAADIMFQYANIGVDGVNWHGVADGISFYNPFLIKESTTGQTTSYNLVTVNPDYYGYVFFQAATGANAHLLPVALNTTANMTAWATVDGSGTPRLAIINKDEAVTGTVAVTINGYTQAQILRLEAPTYQSMTGVTFAGQTFDGSSDGTIQGTQVVETVNATDGVFEIPMPITSGALVVFTN